MVPLFLLFLSKTGFAQTWGPATNLGPNVNTSGLEDGHCITSDSSKLYVATDRAGGLGGADIWVSEYIGNWQVPTNLGSNVNTYDEDYEPCISSDGLKLYFSSYRSGGYGQSDIYESEYVAGTWQPAVNLGPTINTDGYEGFPYITSDGSKLYFAAYEWPGGYGVFDIWVSEYQGAIEEQATRTMNNHWLQTIVSGPLQLPHDKKCVLFDICGKKVDPLNLTPGVYFVQVRSHNFSYIKKIIKSR